jgi:nucleotide-binding universal stress UspA family protein
MGGYVTRTFRDLQSGLEKGIRKRTLPIEMKTMLRSMLVALDESAWSCTATTLALEWATRLDARLIGLALVDETSVVRPEPVPRGAADFKRRRDRARLTDAHKHVQQTLEKFRERCASARVPETVSEDVGDPAPCILRHAHRCDLIVIGRETDFRLDAHDTSDATLGQIIGRSPRPIVVVPRELPQGNGVLVAYGGGREVARTLQIFQLLGLSFNETVHLVNVQRGRAAADTLADYAAEFLYVHGAEYQLHVAETSLEPAEALLEQVRILHPRLMVIGAPGYHPLRDLFATSVTGAVLRECPVPLLIGA